MRSPLRSCTAATGSAALIAGLLGAVVPMASSASAVPMTMVPVAGIETVGPIATVGSGAVQVWPELPPGLAQMPRGGVFNPESPYLSVPSLRAVAETPVRVVDVGRSTVEWAGVLSSGWSRIGATLGYAREYRVEVQRASGAWGNVGSFAVAPRGAGAGPLVDADAMKVSVVTGQVATSWESARMAGPSGGAGVALSWGSNAASPMPGLPAGWQLSAAPGAWALLSESVSDVAPARVPGAALAVRAPGTSTASVSVEYPVASGRWVRRWVAQRKVGEGPWQTVPLRSLRRSAAQVVGTVGVPKAGRVWLRVGARVEETILWGPSSMVVPQAGLASTVSREPKALRGAGVRSLVTPGDQPPVVRLTGWDGTQVTFTRNGLGVYEQAGGAVTGYANRLTWVGVNRWEFADSDGGVTSFVNGKASSYTSKGARLAAYGWDGSGRLTSVVNEIGRTLDLRYAGTDACVSAGWTGSGFVAPPTGQLCEVAYPDGAATQIGYAGVGLGAQVALIKDPGNTGTAFGWDEAGRLVATRSALVSRAATLNPTAADVLTRLMYGADGTVARIIDAPASVGGDSVTRTIDYPTITDDSLRDYDAAPGANEAVSAATRVDAGPDYGDLATSYKIDPITWRAVAFTDARGLTASTGRESSATGAVASSRDSAGRVTTYSYDELGEVKAVAGPVDQGAAGAQATTTYDTARTSAGVDDPLSGMRALVYSQPSFSGSVSAQFLKANYSRGALSASWSGRSTAFSAQASGVWNPASAAQDAAGHATGWQFQVSASGGTDVELVVGGNLCTESNPCVVSGLPTGPKAVSVQVRRAGTAGWFQVLAAPVGQPLAPLPADDVRPGFGLTSVATSNDDIPDGPAAGSETRYAYANPANGVATSVVEPGGLTTAIAHEASSAGGGSWGRQLTTTTPGGKVLSTSYWADDVDAALPDVCGGATVRESGQVRQITRPSGETLTTWRDITGRVRAQVTGGDGASQTICSEYFDDGSTKSTSAFDTADNLLERVTTDPAVGGDPLVSSVTVEHGPAAPVSPNSQVSATTTVDLQGRVVESTDAAGAVTTTTFDVLGRVLTQTITPPAGSGASPLVTTYSYRPLDARLDSITVNGVRAASVAYDGGSGRVARVTYPDGVSAGYAYLPNGALGTVSVRTGDPALGTVVETRTQSGYGRVESARVTSSVANAYTESRGYQYDSAGRLATAVVAMSGGEAPSAGATFGYTYSATQNALCPTGYAGAGKDGLRTGGRVNGTSYVVCHDAKGRLASTTSPLLTGGGDPATATFDGLGRMLTLGGDRPLALTWGVDGQVAVVDESDVGGANRITTTLDAYAGSVLDKTTASDAGTTTTRYAGPFRVTVAGGVVTGTESVQYALPGGATVTQEAGQQAVLEIPGADGSALVQVPVPALGGGTAAIARVAERFGPYGEPLAAIATDTATSTPAYSWRAAQRRETLAGTSSITLLPARAYAPLLGEFLSPDPVLDGANNAYAYTNGDPVNSSDPSGGETEDSTTTLLLSAASAAGGLLALAGGFAYARLALSSKGAFRAGRFILPYASIPGLAVALVASAGAGYAAYAAAKSQQTDEAVSIAAAVGASLASVGLTHLGGKWGMKRLNKAYRAKQMAVGYERAPTGRESVSSGRSQSTSSVRSLGENTLEEGLQAFERGEPVPANVLDRLMSLERVPLVSAFKPWPG